ncbi:MAG TPA: SRPBCC family protein [Streptosporangiaceae bacterium]|nr:SRPBCC family protein [Streptosporangiaceae bacterium]
MAAKLTVTAGVVVSAGQQQVWDLVVDWSRQREWILVTRTDGGHGLGAKVTGRTGIGRLQFADPMEITEWVPPRRCTVTHLGKIVRGHGVFEVLPRRDKGGSEFRWTEEIELPVALPPALAKLVAATLIGPLTRLGLGWSLRRFARLV